jgi:ammonia channel protein AmtB
MPCEIVGLGLGVMIALSGLALWWRGLIRARHVKYIVVPLESLFMVGTLVHCYLSWLSFGVQLAFAGAWTLIFMGIMEIGHRILHVDVDSYDRQRKP